MRHTALAVAVAIGFGFSGYVFAQSTTGTISGQAPVASGETVQIVGGSGFNRTVPVDNSGHYNITLPVGTYDVNLMQNGQIVQTRKGVTALAAGAVAVDFTNGAASSANAQNLSSVMVTANAIPPIDVSSTQESSVITAQQLKNLPLQRSGAAIALLAPGTVAGASALGGGPTGEPLLSFNGSSTAENAYYINGFNTSDPIGNAGGITLPYGAISQQETLTNGYGPEYGRSTGGVVSQIGQSGTDTWHFGGAAFFTPAGTMGTQGNLYYESPYYPATKGTLLDYRNGNSQWEQVYDAYVGGPLIKDKLFFFLAAEADRTSSDLIQPNTQNQEYQTHTTDPKYYAKIDWNITDSNILSLTSMKNNYQYGGSVYNYDYADKAEGTPVDYLNSEKQEFTVNVLKFTSYITDDLTLNAMIGKMDGTYTYSNPANSTLPAILDTQYQNPAYCPSTSCLTNQASNTIDSPNQKSEDVNLRFDLTYKLGDHTLQAGIDNETTNLRNAGTTTTGPGYAWIYGNATPGQPILGTPGIAPYVGLPDANGYYASKYTYVTAASVEVQQRAQYIKDTWQATPNLLLNLGLRNDTFTNYNPDGEPYVRLTKPQWAPRLGFSWDILGDSSMKLFGNAGRYYLALPAGVAIREASASIYTNSYYTYTGITPNGLPTGITPIASCGQTCGAGVPVSPNNEYGELLDPKTVAAQNLGAEYQDSFVLGFQQQFAQNWDYGLTATWTKLHRIIDDTAEGTSEICQQLVNQNPSLGTWNGTCPLNVNGSILVNPGDTNIINVANPAGGYYTADVNAIEMGFPQPKRNYYSLEAFVEHVWDGKWTAKLDYVYSKSYGTTEGPVQSNIGQGAASVSATEQWDFGQLMQYSNGVQANSRKHVLKGYGTYQFLPEWSVSAILTLASGTPESCLGAYGPLQTDPVGYGTEAYHWCDGQPAVPGTTGYTPWLHTLDLALEYRPEWAQKKLAFQVQIRNVTNEQKITQVYPGLGSTAGGASDPLYKSADIVNGVAAVETPRTVQFGVTYDW
ncbi:TonB-dependent receptor [Dyella jejuensis]|uniref:TonB-dependent receptor n=1 Tax=Dyella jejuensis TaxID=1432009 RepID=A0ABW8JGA7_9GAMM